MSFTESKNKFEICHKEKKLYSFYTLKSISRADIDSNEENTFELQETDWTEIINEKKQQMKEKEESVRKTGFYKETKEFGSNSKQVLTYENNKLLKEEWFNANGQLHREGDSPALIQYDEMFKYLREETWFKNGKKHREGDLPAQICYYWNEKNKTKLYETWFINDEIFRKGDLPARISYYENGNKKSEWWVRNKKNHRENDLPACIEYYENGNKKTERWAQNGEYVCRPNNNFCFIRYDENGRIADSFRRSINCSIL